MRRMRPSASWIWEVSVAQFNTPKATVASGSLWPTCAIGTVANSHDSLSTGARPQPESWLPKANKNGKEAANLVLTSARTGAASDLGHRAEYLATRNLVRALTQRRCGLCSEVAGSP